MNGTPHYPQIAERDNEPTGWCAEHDQPAVRCSATVDPSPAGWCDEHDQPEAQCEFANGLRCKVCNVLSSVDNYVCGCHLTCWDHDEDEASA